MRNIPYVDVDYCQFADWGYQKPTRVWGDEKIRELENLVCPGAGCSDLVDLPRGGEVIVSGWEEIICQPQLSINTNFLIV